MVIKHRGKNKIQYPHGMKDIYDSYIKSIDNNEAYYVSFSNFISICGDFYKSIINKVILESKTVLLPNRMGSLTVMKKRPKVINKSTVTPDWEATNRYGNGKLIYFSNDHTAGFKFRFIWSKKECMCVNRSLYKIILSRTNKRMLAKYIKSGTDYLEM